MPRNSSVREGPIRNRNSAEPSRIAPIRCAIYTRKSTEEGLDQEFNSLNAQREAAEAFVRSQRHEGWELLATPYDDGGFTGGNMERPALQRLIADISRGAVNCVIVYKVDRLSRSLLDFARMMELFDRHGVSFVSVTQQFNTTSSLGRLTLNILLSFAQFEREIISERTRDKLSAARKKGKWIGGHPMLGYNIDPKGGRLVINPEEAERVRAIFDLYLKLGTLSAVQQEIARRGWMAKQWTTEAGIRRGGSPMSRTGLYGLLTNALYSGMVDHKGVLYPGEHERIVAQAVWDRVQAMLREAGRTRGAVIRNKYGALLRGLLFCKQCGAVMVHTYTKAGPRRYRYYACHSARQPNGTRCGAKPVGAEPVEGAVLSSIRRLSTDRELSEAVLAEAATQLALRKQELTAGKLSAQKDLRQLNQNLANLAGNTAEDSGQRAERIRAVEEASRAAERRIEEIVQEQRHLEQEPLEPDQLRRIVGDFENVWASLTVREQEQLVKLLVAKVVYDGTTGKVTIGFRSEGARELCQGRNR
jgi:site-specific DNA recombinase